MFVSFKVRFQSTLRNNDPRPPSSVLTNLHRNYAMPKYERLVFSCRFITCALHKFHRLLWASTNLSPWTLWKDELPVYSTLRPSDELDTLSLRSVSVVCNCKNVWRPNTCHFDQRWNKKDSSSEYILSRLIIRILWILFYPFRNQKENITHHQVISLLLWKQRESVYLKCHFVFFFFLITWNYKLEIKFWFLFLYWSWDRKHKTKWFFDFQNRSSF